METVVIFGSTGMTGLYAVKAALDKGYKVRAFVRDPTKLPDDVKSRVEIVQGDVLNYPDVLKAVQNVSGVSVVLGTRNVLKPTTDLSEGQKNIIKAMKEANVTKMSVCLSAFLFYELDKVPPMFKDLNDDHQRQFDAVKASGLDYVAVLPPHIDAQEAENFKIEYDKSPGRIVSKHLLGRFLIEAIFKEEHYGKVCGICNA